MVQQYLSEHKAMKNIIIIFIICFIINLFFSPWDMTKELFKAVSESATETDLPALPVYIMMFSLFGFFDMFCILGSIMDNNSFSMMSVFTVSALFFYAKMAQNSIVSKHEDDYNNIENRVMNYMIDNISAYIVSLLLYILYSPIVGKLSSIMHTPIRTTGNAVAKGVVVILLVLVIIIPGIPYFLYAIAYFFSLSCSVSLIELMSDSLQSCPMFIKTVLLSVATIFFVVAIYCLIGGLFEKIAKKITEKLMLSRFSSDSESDCE